MTTKFLFQQDTFNCIEEASTAMLQTIGSSFGPFGHNILLCEKLPNKNPTHSSTNNFNVIIQSLKIENTFSKSIIHSILSAGMDCYFNAGGACKTTIILISAITLEALKRVKIGINPVGINTGIKKAIEYTISYLNKTALTLKPEEVKSLIFQMVDNTKLANVINTAFEKVAHCGYIISEKVKDTDPIQDTHLEIIEGITIDNGCVNNFFNSNETNITFHNALVFIGNSRLKTAAEVIPLIKIAKEEKRPLLIISHLGDDALHTILINHKNSDYGCVAIDPPLFKGKMNFALNIYSAALGGTFIDSTLNYDTKYAEKKWFGTAKKITITTNTTFIEFDKKPSAHVSEMISFLKFNLKQNLVSDDANFLREMLGILVGNIIKIKIHSSNPTVAENLLQTTFHTLSIVVSAQTYGVLPGGGLAFIKAAQSLNQLEYDTIDERHGIQAVAEALCQPSYIIANNSGSKGDYIIEKTKEYSLGNIGFDASSKEFINMCKHSIFDPLKYLTCALTHASSLATSLISSAVMMTGKKEEKKKNNEEEK